MENTDLGLVLNVEVRDDYILQTPSYPASIEKSLGERVGGICCNTTTLLILSLLGLKLLSVLQEHKAKNHHKIVDFFFPPSVLSLL